MFIKRLTSLVPLPLLGLVAAVDAQTVDTSEWVCEFCPFEDGHRGDYEVGATAVDEDSAYFGDATGYNEEGGYLNVDGRGLVSGDDYRMTWVAEDLGLDSRYAAIDAGRPGSYGVSLDYRELPRRQWITTDTVFDQSAADTLSLPAGWVRSGLTTGMSELDASLVRRDIEGDRSFLGVGGRLLGLGGFDVSADYRRQTNDGQRTFGGSLFTNASLLPMPFDYVTDEVDVQVRYALDSGYLSIGWYLSDFDNQNTALNWESPFTTVPGAEVLSAAQAPDNQFQQLKLGGGYRLQAIRTSVHASLAMGEIEQTTPFLPYTSNANLTPAALPRSNLDGSVDTANYALSIVSRPIPKGRVRLSYRYDERDNRTPVELYERVIVDTILSNDPEANLPYSYERSVIELSGDYDLFDSLRVSGGYERRDLERDLQEVREQTEDTGWGRLRWRPNELIEIDGRAGTSRRDIDSYNEFVAVAFGQNPLMRKYNMAFRYREFAELAVSIMPPGSPLSVTIDSRYADDDYSRSEIGLVAGRELYIGADIGYSVTDRASLYLNVSTENIEAEQFGSEAFAEPDWRAFNDDDYDTIGFGFRLRQIADKVDLQLDWTRAAGTSSIQLDSATEPADLFPDFETTLDFVRLRLGYRHSERLDVNASLTFQRFEAEDWSIEGVGPATIPEVLSLGPLPYDDEQFLVGIGFQYRLGSDTLSEN